MPGLLPSLTNIGNTCFINAGMHMIMSILTHDAVDSKIVDMKLLEFICKCYFKDKMEYIREWFAKVNTNYKSGNQFDSQEFVIQIINSLYKNNKLFKFSFFRYISCSCNKGLKVNKTNELIFQLPTLDSKGKSLIEWDNCIEHYLKPEHIGSCNQCKQPKHTWNEIESVSKYIFVSFNRYNNKLQKVNTPISPPLVWNCNGNKYRLLSSIIHSGSLESGHYTSINLVNNKTHYYFYNDSTMKKMESLDELYFYLNQSYLILYAQV